MLQEKFSSMHGLQTVFLVRTLSFVKQNRPFEQILNVDDSHWVCVAATTDCKFNSVKMFDSRKTGERKEISSFPCKAAAQAVKHVFVCEA